MPGAARPAHRRLRHIDRLGGETLGGLPLSEFGLARLVGGLDAPAGLAHQLAGRGLLILRHLTHARVQAGNRGAIAGMLGSRLLEIGHRRRRGERREGGLDSGIRRFRGDRVGLVGRVRFAH